MEFAIESADDIHRLDPSHAVERLQYVAEALALIQPALGGRTALLGFAGSPWTLANYMITGGSGQDPMAPKRLFYTEPRLFEELMEKLTLAVTEYLKMQIASGVDAVQIFDSLGGELADNVFEAASGRWIRRIITELMAGRPVILFSKDTHGQWDSLVATGANILGVDWTQSLAAVGALLPGASACREPGPRVAHHYAGNRRGGDSAHPPGDGGPARPHFQPRARRAPGGEARLHRSVGGNHPVIQMRTLQVDLDLVKKYNVAGPRYTSYPPATKFTDTIVEFAVKIEANNQSERDLSIYFHIPFCKPLVGFAADHRHHAEP